MEPYTYYSDEISTEDVPCEFCNELYPFNLLIEHQSSCRPDLLHYSMPTVAVASIPVQTVRKVSSPRKTEAFLQKKTEDEVQRSMLKTSTLSASKNVAGKDLLQDFFLEERGAIVSCDSKENDSKLMEYGTKKDRRKAEAEKPRFRVPSVAILNNAYQKEDLSNSLSDGEDAGESLEEYWRRADQVIQSRLKKLQQ